MRKFYLLICLLIVQLTLYGQTRTLDFANLSGDPANGTKLGTTSFTQTTAAQESWTFTMAANSPGFWTYNDQTLWFQSGDPTPTETGKAKTSIKRADGQNFNFKTINFVTFSQDQFIRIEGKKSGTVKYTQNVYLENANAPYSYNFTGWSDVDEVLLTITTNAQFPNNTNAADFYIGLTSFTYDPSPRITTNAASLVAATSAVFNGNLVSAGFATVTEKGFVYATTLNPTTADTKRIVTGTTTGTYSYNETTLSSSTTYHVRAYAINNVGTSYGTDQTFTTGSLAVPVVTGNPPNRTICLGGSTAFPATVTNATSYQWQENSGSGFVNITNGGVYSNATTATLTITGATAGMSGYTYRLVATGPGASATSNAATLTVINITATTSQTNVSCNGSSTGTATVVPAGGIAPYTYSWSPSGGTGATASGLAAGNYTVTITDNISCQTTKTVTITQPTAITATTSQTNVSCNGGTNGAINLTPAGGTAPYTFNWGGGITTEDRTGLPAGTYTVIITDAKGCTATVNATVGQPATAVSGTSVIFNTSCFGGSNGAINLTPAGGTAPYTFNWGGGITTEDRTGLTAGTYTVIITDANGCTATVNATVGQPATAVSGTSVIFNTSCFGGSNGAINLTAAGGTAPYTFNWGGGITTEDRTGLTAGTYTVIITDANGCTATVNATVGQPASAVSGTSVIFNTSCFGGSNGAINLTPAGGTAPYTFNWGGGITTEDRTGLTAGTYTVIITDVNGCTATVNATVSQPATTVSGTTVVNNISCFGGSNGAINLTPAGGTAPYTFNWGGGITTEDRTGLTAGTYTVIITDVNGCTATVNATVTQPATAVSGTTVVNNISCFGGSNGAINLTPAGGTAPYTFNWGGGITTEDRTGLTAGTYTVIITDVNGCTAAVTATVTQPNALASTVSQTNVSCNGGTNGTATIIVTGGTSPYTYSWSPSGGTGATANNLAAGTYTVTVTDANSCSLTRTVTITQSAAVAAPTGTAVQSFNAGDTLSALVVNGQSIKWYASQSNATNHTSSLPLTTPIVNNTTYYATQTSGACESTASLAVLAYNPTLSVGSVIKATSGLQIYPNPVSEILTISGDDKVAKLVVSTLDGRKITEKILRDGERGINVSSLIQGTYLIKVITKSQVKTFKFIKK
jgi:hypothetical protein